MFKTKEEIIVIQAEAKEPIATRAVFWSHDKGTAKMLFKLRKDGTSQSLAEGTIVPVVLDFNSETAENGRGRHIYHAVIEDAVNGIVSIVLEDNILGYQGRVDGSIYIELPDSRSLDTAGRFTFHIKRSPIDEDVPELEDYYWQGFNDIMEQYHESIAEIKLEAKTTLDSLTADVIAAKTKVTQLEQSITTANTNLNSHIDEINKKIDDNDVFTKAESSANVIDNIAGTEVVTFKKEFLVNGGEATAARDDNGTLIAFNEDDYTKLITNDSYVRTETLVSGRGAATKYTFPIISTVASKYPAAFEHLSLSEKITYFLSILKSVKIKMVHRGGGPLKTVESNNYKSRGYIQTAGGGRWGLGSILASSDNFTTQNHTLDAAAQRQIISDGTYVIWHVSQMIGYPNEAGVVSDGVTPAWIECKEIILTVEFSLNGKTIIESMIAQNHVENLATQNEAETGTDNTKTMTPLRTAQAIDKKTVTITGNQTVGGIKNFKDGLMLSGVSAATLIDIKEYRTSATATVPAALTSSISSIKYTLLRVGNRVKFWATVNVTTATGLDAVPEILTIPAGYKIDPTLAAAQNQIKLDVGQLLVNAVINNYAAILTSTSVFRFGTTREGNHYISGEWLTADAVPV